MLIIDTETTGLEGYPRDRVLEIGIAELSPDGNIKELYSEVIRYPDIIEFDSNYVNRDGSRGIWVYRNSSLRIEDTLDAEKDLETVVKEVRELVADREVTSYNVPFDFGKFLDHDPWNLKDVCSISFDIMDLATDKVYQLADDDLIDDKGLQKRILWERGDSSYPNKWVRSDDAYRILCPNDSRDVGRMQKHRALDDAVRESYVLLALLG